MLAVVMEMFVYLKVGRAFVLVCWGQKDAGRCRQNSIGVMRGILLLSVLASLMSQSRTADSSVDDVS